MLRSSLAIVLGAALLLVAPARAAGPAQAWLVLSDIHFDPFTQPHLVDRLAAAPADRWRAIFAAAPATAPSGIGSDTNYALLESTLEGARNAVPNPPIVIVAGDLLAHEFRAKFDRTATDHDDAAYDAFVDKTIGFLAWELQEAFPRSRLLPAIGNNDSYCGDYETAPHGAFLAHMAAAFAGSIGVTDPTAFIAQFSTGGYYTAPLPVDGARAIVLNDVFWSADYKNACGDPKADPGGDEVKWLQSAQNAIPAGTPVWIIAHIPPGIDAISTIRGRAVVPFLTDGFNQAFITALDSGSAVVMAIAGHTHMDSFRVIGPDASTPRAPMLVVPAVSPIFGNAPSFTVLAVDPNSAQVDDSRVFILSKIRSQWSWHREYDFDSIYGSGPIDASDLWRVQQTIFGDERVRRRFEEFYQSGGALTPVTELFWRAFWCADVALTVTEYTACAQPQIQHNLPPHPSPPPLPSPSPSPSASPS
ncbi:MAG TPA: hypothetical protein VMF11_03830 [Candidatus Baltobacteraceae bacterium]|nr:hypothetical protein [Candidatus Baltobacteraceae bacterium]